MNLELIRYLPKRPSSHPPLLFVHGAFSGAWCWEEFFLPYLATQGYAAYAVSLRGHGHSGDKEQLPFASLADYVADVASVSSQLEQPPILVGHSMGGMVVQKYLEAGHLASAAVLMASVPPTGLWLSSCYLAWTQPWLFWQLSLVQYVSLQFATPAALKQVLFSKQVPDETVEKYVALMQNESYRVIMDMLWLDLPSRRPQSSVPMLVLGATEDVFFPPPLVTRTAQFYGTQARLFPQMGHAMMLEMGWQQVADGILAWLEEECQTV